MQLIVLKEGNFNVNKNKDFFLLEENPNAGLKMAVQPFLVQTQNDVILLDTGLGFVQKNGKSAMMEQLAKANIAAEQVTKILLSHLHKDHISGIGFFSDNVFHCRFPNAKIYVQQREWTFANTQRNSPSYDFKILDALMNLPQIVFLNEDKGTIDEHISYEVSGGHTPFHQVFWISENEQIIFYGADVLPLQAYMKSALAYKSDFDGKKALITRKNWTKEAAEKHWLVLFYHDMKTPYLQL